MNNNNDNNNCDNNMMEVLDEIVNQSQVDQQPNINSDESTIRKEDKWNEVPTKKGRKPMKL